MQTDNHIYLDTRNFTEALSFWQALGFRVEETRGPRGHRTCDLVSDEAELVSEGQGDLGAPRMHFRVKDIKAVTRRLSKGFSVVHQPRGAQWNKDWVRVDDPDGNAYALEALSN